MSTGRKGMSIEVSGSCVKGRFVPEGVDEVQGQDRSYSEEVDDKVKNAGFAVVGDGVGWDLWFEKISHSSVGSSKGSYVLTNIS